MNNNTSGIDSSMNFQFHGVLLDFNGTLFFDTPFHVEAWHNFVLRRDGIDLPMDEVRRRMIGPGNYDILRSLYGTDLSEDKLKALSNEKEEAYRDACRKSPSNMKLRPGATEFLDYLTKEKVPFALVTVSIRENVDFYLNELGLAKWFTMDRVVYDEGILATKPAPDFYVEAARRIHRSPAECLVAEDSVSGIRSAISAGAGRTVVLSGTAPDAELAPYLEKIHRIVPDFRGFEGFLR